MNKQQRWRWALGLMSIMLIGTAWADSPMYRGDVYHTGGRADIQAPPTLMWRWASNNPTANNVSSPAVVGNTVYFGAGNRFVALDVETGVKKWQYPTDEGGGSANFKTAPAVADGLVYVGASDGNLYALRADTGKLAWSFRTASPINSAPIVVEDKVYFGSNDGTLYGVNAKTGEPIYGKEAFKAGSYIPTSPIYNDGFIVFASDDGFLYGLQASTAKPKWPPLKLPSTSNDISPVMAGGTVYLNSGSTLYALNNSNGRTRWSKQFASDLVVPPTTDGKTIFVINDDSRLYSLDSSGKLLWKKPVQLTYAPSAPPTLAGKMLIVPQRRGLMTIFDAETGDLKWQYVVRPMPTNALYSHVDSSGNAIVRQDYVNVAAAPTVANGMLFLLGEDGSLLAFSSKKGVDVSAPDVEYMVPEPGDRMPGQPPLEVTVRLDDWGSGVNPDTVKLLLNDEALEGSAYDPIKGTVTFKFTAGQTIKPLSDGRQTFRVEATDWAGNKLNRSWSVLVDNSLRKVAKKRYSGNRPSGGGPTGPGGYPGGPRPPGAPGMGGGGPRGGGGAPGGYPGGR